MGFFALTVVLSTCICLGNGESKQVEKIDWNFADKVLHSYFCTGDRAWWENIEKDPALRLMMHVGVEIYCYTHTLQERYKEILEDIIREAREAVQLQSLTKRKEVSNCLWDAFRHWQFVPLLCPYPSEKFMERFDKTTDQLVNNVICIHKDQITPINGTQTIACDVGRWILSKRDDIRKAVHPHLCHNHRLIKRQYDVVSVMAVFKQTACLKSAENNFEIEYIAEQLEDEKPLHFSTFSCWCCVSKFIRM